MQEYFGEDLIQMMHSDANDEKQVLRIRFNGLTDQGIMEDIDDDDSEAATAV